MECYKCYQANREYLPPPSTSGLAGSFLTFALWRIPERGFPLPGFARLLRSKAHPPPRVHCEDRRVAWRTSPVRSKRLRGRRAMAGGCELASSLSEPDKK